MEIRKYGKMEKWKNGKMEKWKYGNVEMWKYGNMETWKCGNVEIWKYGNMEIWKYGVPLEYWAIHFGFCIRCGIAGGEQVSPPLLGWYFLSKSCKGTDIGSAA